ncbi:hypothetical protein [Puia dinghuensis]|uniref:Uncharacterized protein n=1 Tax=Puia dinghuensis TaxID=1792502 RepID=A0A8J2UBM1_9BACT|nr:hypothetical protein [Puia dinghuensis]GGA94539.1 hypothetical protein GCM10011511_17290 [Puia dinghuensis]
MKKIITSGLIAGVVLLVLSILGLYATIWFFPTLAAQYYDPAFDSQSGRYMIYYAHPFVIGLALAWFWDRFKVVLKGSFLTRGIEFGLAYALVAIFPVMWLTYSALSVSLAMVGTWLAFGLLQGIIAGLVFEKTNP